LRYDPLFVVVYDDLLEVGVAALAAVLREVDVALAPDLLM
jgi:hypothetical protein